MRRLINMLLGTVSLKIAGPFPERLINLCAQERIDFWALSWLDSHTITMTVHRHSLPRLQALAQRVSCEVEVQSRRGLPHFLARFRKRYAFLIGSVFALCAVGFLSRFILTIEVTGNQKVPTAVILSQLRQLGVRPGVYGPSLERKQLAQEALVELDGLSWMAINLHGTRLEVIVREVVEQPERVDESGFFHVVAEADGVITHVEAEQGDAVVQEGDVVAAGDVLISGTVTLEPPIYSDLPTRYYQTHARGRVWARTWRTLTAAIPLETAVKDYTGAERRIWSVHLLGRRIKILGKYSISQSNCDKMTTVRQAVLPGDVALPLFLVREELREYEPRIVQVDREAAQDLLEQQLLARLEGLLGEDGTVESVRYSAQIRGGLLRVDMTAQCLEEIGREEPGAAAEQIGEGGAPAP